MTRIAVSVRTALVLAMAAGALALLTGCSERRSQQSLQEGDMYLHQHNYEQALAAYRRALDAKAGNAPAKRGMARVLWAQKKHDEALAAYEEAIETDPAYATAYIEAARLLTETQRAPEAEEMARRLAAVDRDEGELLLASVYLESGRAASAVEVLEGCRDRAPDSVAIHVALAGAHTSAGAPDQAEAVLKDFVERNAENTEATVPARLALVDIYRNGGKTDNVLSELQAVVADKPEDLDIRLVLARALLEAGRYNAAQEAATPVLQQRPDSGWANFVVGSCYLARQEYAQAVPYLETAAQAMPDQPAVERQLALARAGNEPGETPGPQEPTREASTPGPAPAPTTSARLTDSWSDLWRSGQLARLVDDRQRLFAEVGESGPLLEALAFAAYATGRRAALDELLPRLPDDSALDEFVRHVEAREFREAVAVMTPWETASADRRLLAMNALGFAAAKAGARLQALRVLARARSEYPDSVVSLHLLANVYRAAEMPELAERVLQKLLETYPDSVEARQMLYQVYLESGRLEEARTTAESAYLLFRDRRETILSLAHVYMRTGQTDLAQQVLGNGLKALPDDPVLLIALAELRLAQGNAREALETLAKTGPEADLDLMRRPVLSLSLAQQDDWTGLRKVFQGVDAGTLGVPMLFLRAAATLQAGQTADAAAALSDDRIRNRMGLPGAVLYRAMGERAPGITPQGEQLAQALAPDAEALTEYAYAMACREAGLHREALESFSRIAQRVGDLPYLVTLQLATIAAAPDLPDKADRGRAFVDRHPQMAEAWLGLADLRRRAGDPTGGVEALARARELNPDSAEVWLQYAQIAEDRKDSRMAIEAYGRLTDLVPDGPSFQNNYAYYLLQENGDLDVALKAAQVAAQGLPNNPSVLHTLGLAQLRAKQLEEAHRNLRLAVEFRPGDPTLLLDYGQVLMAMGETDKGREQVILALQCADLFGLDFPRRAEAERIAGAPAPANAPAPPAGNAA